MGSLLNVSVPSILTNPMPMSGSGSSWKTNSATSVCVCNRCTMIYRHNSLLCKKNTNHSPKAVNNHISCEQTVSEPSRSVTASVQNEPKVEGVESYQANYPETGDIIFPVQQVRVHNSSLEVLLFYDSGSNCSYITLRAAKRLDAKCVKGSVNLNISLMGGKEQSVSAPL